MISVLNPHLFQRHWNWIALSGPDTQDFLHRLTTVQVKFMKEGSGSPGCFLTVQGKMRSYFNLWHYSPQEFAFEFEAGSNDHWKNELLAAIDQYTFGEQMTLTDTASKLETRWIFAEEGTESLWSGLQPGETKAIDEEIRVCHHGNLDYGRPWITAWGRPARIEQWIDQAFPQANRTSLEEIESWRIASVRPRIDHEIQENSLPLEVGLWDAIASNKGCYPGQEVIEKIISLGSPPRRLVQLQSEVAFPAAGTPIVNLAEPPLEVGQITSTSSVKTPEGLFQALGLLKKIHAKEGLKVQTGASQAVIAKVAPYALS